MRVHFVLPFTLILAACQPQPPSDPAPIDMIPKCGADQLRGLVGQDAAVLREIDLPTSTRVVRPGMMLTADYRPERLNISIGEDGIIDRVWCT